MAVGDLLAGVSFGVEYNGWAATGASPKLTDLDGVESLVELRRGNLPRGAAHGSIKGPIPGNERIIAVEVTMHGSAAKIRQQVDELVDATTLEDTDPDELPLVWSLAELSELRRAYVRCVGRSLPVDRNFAHGRARAVLQFEATDPRIYGNVEQSGSTGVGSLVGGLELPHGFPHAFGTAQPGTIDVTNTGRARAPWTATLTGPLSSPIVELVGAPGRIEFAGLNLGSGDTLELDSLGPTAKLNGTADRLPTVRDWFHLPAGTSSVQLLAAGGSGSLALRWRNTRL